MNVARFSTTGSTLLQRLGERLPPVTHDIAGSMLEAGEWGFFMDELAAALTRRHIPVDATERDLLRELLYSFEREASDEKDYPMIWRRDEVLASLNVVEATPRRQAG